jgi:hypothetical protein
MLRRLQTGFAEAPGKLPRSGLLGREPESHLSDYGCVNQTLRTFQANARRTKEFVFVDLIPDAS